MEIRAVIALGAATILFGTMGLKLWSALTLLHRYRAADYVRDPGARVLYVTNIATSIVLVSIIVLLACLTKIWWIVAFVTLIASIFAGKIAWTVWMRRSGRWEAYYASRQWR